MGFINWRDSLEMPQWNANVYKNVQEIGIKPSFSYENIVTDRINLKSVKAVYRDERVLWLAQIVKLFH